MENTIAIIGTISVLFVAGIIYLKRSLSLLHKESTTDEKFESRQEEVIELRERLKARDDELSRLQTENKTAREESKSLSADVTQLHSELAAANSALKQIPVLTTERDTTRAALDDEKIELSKLSANYAELRTRREEEEKAATDKLNILQESEKRLTQQFENLANRIFDEKHEKFSETSKASIENLLKPVKEQLASFRKKVEDVYDKESKDRTSLFNQIVQLKELNERMSSETLNLTKALKGESKTRGSWGEIQLERILEASGLEKGREYDVQVGARNAEGKRYIPDVIVHLPEKKDVIIDSKVSLVAYDRYHSAKTEEDLKQAIKDHIDSVRIHLNDLGEKNYETLIGINSLDLVIMFVPIDGALLLALEHDPTLTDIAFSQNVWLVSPMNLIGTLRIIYNIWRYEYQNRNALEIATQAGGLHDQFVLFVESLADIGKNIDKVQAAYDLAHKRLIEGRGNLVNRTLKLQKLGAKAKKNIPESLLNEAEDNESQKLIEPSNDDVVTDDRN